MLDGPLGGGLPRGLVTELVGEAGAGKSQLALQLLLTAQWPEERGGLAGRALYIHTEGVDPMRRLRDLAARQAERGLVGEDACDHIFLEACLGGAEDLLRVLERARGLAQRLGADGRPLRLLVVDSVGALFRDEVGGDGGRGGGEGRGEGAGGELRATPAGPRRVQLLFRVAQALRRLAADFGLAVLVTNHVVDCVEGNLLHGLQTGNLRRLVTSGRCVTPALGLHWAHCVHARLFVSKTALTLAQESAQASGVVRRLQVAFAPMWPPGECHFIISPVGVQGIPARFIPSGASQGGAGAPG